MEHAPHCGGKIERRDPVLWSAAALALVGLGIHLYTNIFAGYGIFRDELYYIACSKRLALGYVDHPPLSIYILRLWRAFFGQSVFSIRTLPALAGAASVFVTGLLARRLGGGRTAVVIACIAVTFTPVYLGMHGFYSMNAFDILLWALAFYLVAGVVESGGAPGSWLRLGFVLGLGLLNKTGFLWFGCGLLAGLILTRNRRMLGTPWPWIAGATALVLFLPYVVWNVTHGLAHLEFMRNASRMKYAGVTPLDFLAGQIVYMNPLSPPLWLCGLWWLLADRKGRRHRMLGIVFCVTAVILLVNRTSKPEYLAPAYTALFAGGGVFFERLSRRRILAWTRIAVPALIVGGGVAALPIALPILSEEGFIAHQARLGMTHLDAEGNATGELPLFFADMHGWENMARTVSGVYESLDPEERASCIVFCRNYGEAGAIEYYAGEYPVPRAVSPHNSCWHWGYGDREPAVVIHIGESPESLGGIYESVEPAAVIVSEYAMPYETNLPVFVCRGLKLPMREFWRESRFYI